MRQSNPENTNNNNEVKEPQTAEEYIAYTKSLLGETPVTTHPRHSGKAKTGSYQDEVNALLKEVTVGEDGKFVYPDNTPEHLKFAVAAEKKYRDTQSGFTKTSMSLKEAETENEALRNQLSSNSQTALELSLEDTDRLESLMYSNPAEWRREMNELESKHSQGVRSELDKQMGEVRHKAGQQFELDRRINVLKEFNVGREIQITPDMLDGDIPPRITKKLADGLLTFEGYLSEVDTYLSKGKVISNQNPGSGTSLTQGAGSHTPGQGANQQNEAIDYASTTL